MTPRQFDEITAWQKETFPQATPFSKVCHLEKEVIELREALVNKTKETASEFADCFMLLFGAAHAAGFTFVDICEMIDKKMEVNKTRKWGRPDSNGVVEHIRE